MSKYMIHETVDTKLEKETRIWWSKEGDEATVQTYNRTFQKQLESMGLEPYGYDHGGRFEGRLYKVPKNWISIRPPRKGNPEIAKYAKKGVKSRKGTTKS